MQPTYFVLKNVPPELALMSDKKELPAKNKFSPDWLVRGVLTKIGDMFDKLTGRSWKPSSSLATSELIERLKKLIDSEVKDLGEKGRFVPHNMKLKMQWDKFSTDAEDALKRLENELVTAAIDHINDNRYHTYSPLKLEVKPDYFTEGVRLTASFNEFGEEDKEAAMNVTIPQMKVENLMPPEPEPESEDFIAEFTVGDRQKSVELKFSKGKRLSVGRTKENNLTIDDTSVSKVHATLMVNAEDKFLVADTGSTNGTFINGERIAYGRAFAVSNGEKVKFGTVEVFFRRVPKETTFVTEEAYAPEEIIEEDFATKDDYKTEEETSAVKNDFETSQEISHTREGIKLDLTKDEEKGDAQGEEAQRFEDTQKTGL